jgi:4-hydroxythreonine-4-phosphate dehydrogenase
MGDPSGIGPEVIMKSMASPDIRRLAIFVIVADTEAIKRASEKVFSEELVIHEYTDEDKEIKLEENRVNILDPGPPLKEIEPGKFTDKGAAKALECIKVAAEIMNTSGNKAPKAMVTAPVSKEAIARVHQGFVGHTEYLQEACSAKSVCYAAYPIKGSRPNLDRGTDNGYFDAGYP